MNANNLQPVYEESPLELFDDREVEDINKEIIIDEGQNDQSKQAQDGSAQDAIISAKKITGDTKSMFSSKAFTRRGDAQSVLSTATGLTSPRQHKRLTEKELDFFKATH